MTKTLEEKSTKEALISLLCNLAYIPCFHEAKLFTSKVYKMTGFQINTKINNVNRLVFSLDLSNENDLKKLQETFKKEYGYEIEEEDSLFEILNREYYNVTGSDSINDISPSTIVHLLLSSEKEQDKEDCLIPLFLLKISEAAEKWQHTCEEMAKNAKIFREITEEVYEKIL
jgi:hypothetical protein